MPKRNKAREIKKKKISIENEILELQKKFLIEVRKIDDDTFKVIGSFGAGYQFMRIDIENLEVYISKLFTGESLHQISDKIKIENVLEFEAAFDRLFPAQKGLWKRK